MEHARTGLTNQGKETLGLQRPLNSRRPGELLEAPTHTTALGLGDLAWTSSGPKPFQVILSLQSHPVSRVLLFSSWTVLCLFVVQEAFSIQVKFCRMRPPVPEDQPQGG